MKTLDILTGAAIGVLLAGGAIGYLADIFTGAELGATVALIVAGVIVADYAERN